MFDLHLTAEQLEIRNTVRDFVAREIKPIAVNLNRLEQFDRHFPLELLDAASRLGLRTLALSEDSGGAGADHLTSCIVAEELAAGDIGIASMLLQTSTLAHILFDQRMTPEQRARFNSIFLADDRYHLAFADHEPGTGSEPGRDYHAPLSTEITIRTTATRDSNGDLVLNGLKTMVANGHVAKLFAVNILLDPKKPGVDSVRTILVPRDTPGLSVQEHDKSARPLDSANKQTFPFYHGVRGDLVFTNCKVPAENLLGETGKESLIQNSRPILHGLPEFHAMNLGIGRIAYEAALEYAQLRVQGGQPIFQHEAIGMTLADMAIKLEAARHLIWHAAWTLDHPDAVADGSVSNLPLQTIAAVFTSEAVHKITLDAALIFGGSGVMRDLPLQKYVRDALIFVHSENNNDTARFRIAEALAGYPTP